jgi:hypothetical protein
MSSGRKFSARKTAFIVALILVIVAVMRWNRPEPVAPAQAPQTLPATPIVETPAAPPTETVPAEPAREPQVQPAPVPRRTAQKQALNPPPRNQPPREPLHDPEARDALALVGMDPDAEEYWLEAIYDTSLPDNEREDLMEDLNEVGFSDPKNLTPDDLPLIMNRLVLIQQIAPNTDDFMAEHLGEAYKDLANMYDRVASRR